MSRPLPPCTSTIGHSWWTEQQTGHRHCFFCLAHRTQRESIECSPCALCSVRGYAHRDVPHDWQVAA